MNWIILTIPGAVVAYVLYVRPILRAMPMFKRFYEEADGFWQTLWVMFGKSITMLWAAVLQVLSWALQMVDPIASFLGDPDLREQISEALQTNPEVLGKILMAISFITVAARLRGMMKASEEESPQ